MLTASIFRLHELRNTRAGCSKIPSSKAAGESKPEAYPQGYVEDFDEPTCLREAASAKAGNDAGGLFQHPPRLRLWFWL